MKVEEVFTETGRPSPGTLLPDFLLAIPISTDALAKGKERHKAIEHLVRDAAASTKAAFVQRQYVQIELIIAMEPLMYERYSSELARS
jgi:hypothetical protein